MTGRHVVVVGSINVDLVVAAPTLPAPGETVIGSGLATFGGGKGANAAVAAARVGADVRLVAAVGADDHGRRAVEELRVDGVDVGSVAALPGHPTGVALIVVDDRGENQIALGPGANHALSAGQVVEQLAPLLDGAGCVLVSTEIADDAIAAAVAAAIRAGVPCVLNPAPVVPGVATALAGVSAGGIRVGEGRGSGPDLILTPNATELGQLCDLLGLGYGSGGGPHRQAGPDSGSLIRALAGWAGAPAVVTLGAAGCLLARPDGSTDAFPAAPVTTVADTTGAGDTFNGVLAARLAAGDEIAAAVEAAVVAASLSVTAVGARTGMPGAGALAAALSAR